MTPLRIGVKLTLMRKLSLYIFLLLMFCNIGVAEWKNFTPNDPTGMYTYFDTTSIKKSDGYTQVWTMTDYPYPDSEGNHSNKVLYNFDCNSLSAKFIEAIVYTGQMGKGTSTSILERLPGGWHDFGPNSVNYNLAKNVCS